MAQQYPDEPTPGDPTTPTPNPNPGGPGDASGQYATDDQIRLLYKEWLWRDPSEAEIAMHRNAPFAEVKANIVNSPEHIQKWTETVQGWAQELLGHPLDAASLDSARQSALTNIGAVRQGILNSPEYKARQTANPTPTTPTPATPTPTTAPKWNSSLQGFDQGKFADATHQTMKYRVARIMAKYPATKDGYAAFVKDPELLALGFTGDGKGNIIAGKTQYGVKQGDVIDVMGGYNAGGTNWWWGAPDESPAAVAGAGAAGSGSAGAGAAGAGTAGTGSTLADLASGMPHLDSSYGKTFNFTPWVGSGITGIGSDGTTSSSTFDWTPPPVTPFSFDKTAPAAYSYQDFVAPTEADLYQDPSYKVRFEEGQRAVDSSAAANGSLLTGGTLKALAKYGQDQGSKEYANIYARNLNTYGTNQGNAKDAYASAFDQYKTAFDQASTAYKLNSDAQGANFDRTLTAAQAKDAIAYRDALANYNQQYGQYQDQYKMWLEDQNRQFDQMYKLADLGATMAVNSYK